MREDLPPGESSDIQPGLIETLYLLINQFLEGVIINF